MSFFKGDVDLPLPEDKILTEAQLAVINKFATKTVEKGMAIPAIMFLESIKPLNFISSQAMVFFEPIVQTVFNFKDYDNLQTALEKRESVEILIRKIEEMDAVSHAREKRIKKFLKSEKKKWKWYQRYLGFFTPKVNYPDEVIYGPEGKPDETKEKTEQKCGRSGIV